MPSDPSESGVVPPQDKLRPLHDPFLKVRRVLRGRRLAALFLAMLVFAPVFNVLHDGVAAGDTIWHDLFCGLFGVAMFGIALFPLLALINLLVPDPTTSTVPGAQAPSLRPNWIRRVFYAGLAIAASTLVPLMYSHAASPSFQLPDHLWLLLSLATAATFLYYAVTALLVGSWGLRGWVLLTTCLAFLCYVVFWPLPHRGLEHCRKMAYKMRTSHNLRMLVIALHNYHVDYKQLPPHAHYSAAGKPLLSWRVLLLPYLEQEELYQQFHLDEPWDSPHNLALLPRMPDVFRVRGLPVPTGRTYYQLLIAAPDYHGKYAPIYRAAPDYRITLEMINARDGADRTILLVEGSRAVPWTKPEDQEIDDSIDDDTAPLPPLGGLLTGSRYFAAAITNGWICSYPRYPHDPQEFKRLFRRLVGMQDGESVDHDDVNQGGSEK